MYAHLVDQLRDEVRHQELIWTLVRVNSETDMPEPDGFDVVQARLDAMLAAEAPTLTAEQQWTLDIRQALHMG